MLTKPKTLGMLIKAQSQSPHDLGMYLHTCGIHQHFIAPQHATTIRSIAWSTGTLLLLSASLPNGRKVGARVFCKNAEIVKKTQTRLMSSELLSVKLGSQLTRSLWCLLPQV